MIESDDLKKKIIEWGAQYLTSHNYTLKNSVPENVQTTPWSYVVRFATSDGYVYLKHMPNLLALEADITQKLHDQFHASVPIIIANNAELNCFLMKDAGRSLRGMLKKQFDANLLCQAIDKFTSLQLAVADHVNIFLDMGVPDWRLDKLADLFKHLLLQKELLQEDGLSELEIGELEKLLPKISALCKKLADYSIRQSVVQCDFHDNNILVDEAQNITFIDLGEIVISHPFFSLVGCLRQMKKHHGLKEEDDMYQLLLDACLNNFIKNESKKNLREAFAIAQILWCVYEMLGQYRLMLACGTASILSVQRGKLSGAMRELRSNKFAYC